MDGNMPWYKSKIIVGALLAVLAQILSGTGAIAVVTPDDQARLADLIVQLVGAVGAILALGARLTQKRAPSITLTKQP